MAERAFLRVLEGGCQVPIGAHAACTDDGIYLQGFVGSLDGSRVIRKSIDGGREDAEKLGSDLADKCLSLGASEILNAARIASSEAA
jgi:hydroxymethylbilane synthase